VSSSKSILVIIQYSICFQVLRYACFHFHFPDHVPIRFSKTVPRVSVVAMAEATDYRQIINDFKIKSTSVANMDGESSQEKMVEPDSLLLCDYVRLRKVRTGVRTSKQKAKITKTDKKLKVLLMFMCICIATCIGGSKGNP